MLTKPLLAVLQWQAVATAVLTLLAGGLAGKHAAISAALGGAVSFCAGLVSALVATRKADSAGGVLVTALMAEGIKLGVIVILLWLVLANYQEVVVAAFLGSFVATALLFSMAFFVREYN